MAWYDSAVFYHMYPLGMVAAERKNHLKTPRHRFSEICAYLPYLKVLGADAVYIGPLFQSGSHGYDTTDYYTVDYRLGDNEDLRKFVREAHNYGIRIILDGVFNHSGRGFFAFKDICERGAASPYKSWYQGIDFGGVSSMGDNFRYNSWRGVAELPVFNFNEEAVRRYFIDVVRFWVEEFDIDGVRLDCADVLDISFQKSLRYFTNPLKPEFFLLGEVIHGEYARWVNPETLHSVTNYELHKSIYSGFNEHNFFEISHNLNRNIAIAGELYTFLENHDVDRIASKLNESEDLRLCYMALFTLPGHPSIYYGGEFGLEGRKQGDDDSPLRPSIQLESMKPNAFTSFVAKLAEIHGRNTELHRGEFKDLYLQCGQWAYARYDRNSAVITALNNEREEKCFYVTLPLDAGLALDLLSGEELEIEADRRLFIRLSGKSGRIIKVKS